MAVDVTWAAELMGKVLCDRYQVESVLGAGGMGAVLRATHIGTGRPVAVKVMLPTLVTDTDLVKRFHLEARAAAAVGHDGVVDVLDLANDPRVGPILVLELLEGESMSARLHRRRALTPDECVTIVLQILDILAAVHAKGIVHRDLKPANVFLARTPSGERVKLVDFGVARVEHAMRTGRLTLPGTALGTPRFMPPEQVRGEADIDGRADLYAVGAILYYALAGIPPYAEVAPEEMLLAVLRGPPTPLEQVCSWAAPGLMTVVAHAMARDRDARYATATIMHTDLAAFAPAPGTAPGGPNPAISSVEAALLAAGATKQLVPSGSPASVRPPPVQSAPPTASRGPAFATTHLAPVSATRSNPPAAMVPRTPPASNPPAGAPSLATAPPPMLAAAPPSMIATAPRSIPPSGTTPIAERHLPWLAVIVAIGSLGVLLLVGVGAALYFLRNSSGNGPPAVGSPAVASPGEIAPAIVVPTATDNPADAPVVADDATVTAQLRDQINDARRRIQVGDAIGAREVLGSAMSEGSIAHVTAHHPAARYVAEAYLLWSVSTWMLVATSVPCETRLAGVHGADVVTQQQVQYAQSLIGPERLACGVLAVAAEEMTVAQSLASETEQACQDAFAIAVANARRHAQTAAATPGACQSQASELLNNANALRGGAPSSGSGGPKSGE